jgi:hypothetical protein
MRLSKRSTMPLKQKLVFFRASEDQNAVFTELRKILKTYAKTFDVRVDDSHQFELWTEHEYRSNSFHPRRQRGVLFAGISIHNTHVGLYYYPLHINPAMAERLPAELRETKKGQSAFHFTEITSDLAEQIRDMLDEGVSYYRANGWIIRSL